MQINLNIPHNLMLYKTWANKLIFEAVSELPHKELYKERKNLFPSIIRVLNHMYIVDLIWQAHLERKEHGLKERNPEKCPSLEKIWLSQQKMDEWYTSYSEQLSIDELNEKIDFKFMNGDKGIMTRNEILLHIVNHATYHRGFIADMFYQIPIKPPTTDFPIFLQVGSHSK